MSSLSEAATHPLLERLEEAHRITADEYPGESGRRQPVHTVYGGAHLFKSDSAAKLGALALRSLERYGTEAKTFAEAIGLGEGVIGETVYQRVIEKLRREPVEDFRIDFEDGYGNRPDAEEDGHARSTAEEVAKGLAGETLPPFIGIRIKPFTPDLQRRAIRTLDVFLTTLVQETGGRLPEGLVVTLPKVVSPQQVAVLADLLGLLEEELGLEPRSLPLEIMVETTQAIIDRHGQVALPGLVQAGQGRLIAAHFGTYDYTAACNVTAAHQHMTHPACDFARHVMQVSLAGRGLWLSDGATNVLPVPVHPADEEELTREQVEENRRAVHAAWSLHFGHVRRSLAHAFYQGWDLHPAQLPTRYAAVFSFFLEGLEAAAERLRNFVDQAARATLAGEVFDDAATGQGLLNFFLRAVNSGAIEEHEALSRTRLSREELRARSFLKILERGRRDA